MSVPRLTARTGIPTNISNFRQCFYPLSGPHLPSPPYYWSRDTVAFYYQTAKSISTSYDALVDLFDCIGNFLKRLEIHRNFTPGITEIAVKVLAELLSVLGLATKQIKMGRFSKYILMKLSVIVQRRLNIEQRSLEENC
jgi:hypothetical protein